MNSKFLFLIDFALWKLYTTTFCLLVLLIYCWWSFAYTPLQATIDSYKSQIKLLPDQKNVSLACKKRCRLLVAELKKKKAEVEQISLQKPPEQLYGAIETLIHTIAKNKLILQNYTHVKQTKNSAARIFSFFLSGDFYSFMSFLETLEKSNHAAACKKCVLKKIDESLVSCHLTVTL